jgi:hypothetical protein
LGNDGLRNLEQMMEENIAICARPPVHLYII